MKLKRHVVILGGGFAGLAAARALAKAPVRLTLVDRKNHHLFQPLLYQVAMAGLSPAHIASPIRNLVSRQKNAKVLLGDVTHVDLARRRVTVGNSVLPVYDFLVVAVGARTEYFGHPEWRAIAPGLKDLDDAVEIRRRVLVAFEAAERDANPDMQRRHLTFVVIGGGPTGVELAGAIAELASFVLARDFSSIHPDATRVVLLEGGPRVLPSFPPDLSERARASLEEMGIEVRCGVRVTDIDEHGVRFGDERIDASTVLWSAGVSAEPLTRKLGAPVDGGGRVFVERDCSLPGRPEVFCVGDAAAFVPAGAGRPLPGVSPVAMQQGRFAAAQIVRTLSGKPRETFVYRDRGAMATIGRSRAVAAFGKLQFSGFAAWLAWLLVHVYFLVDFRNRLLVLIDWAWSYFTYGRGARLITGGRLDPGKPELDGRLASLPLNLPSQAELDARADAAPVSTTRPTIAPAEPAPRAGWRERASSSG